MPHRRCILLLFLGAFALLPASSALAAGTASVTSPGEVTFTAGDGDGNNSLTVVDGPAPGTIQITDVKPITPGAGCSANGANSVRCGPANSFVADLKDGNDTVDVQNNVDSTLLGGPGGDPLHGGGGDDTLDGGPGADELDGRGGTDTADYSSRTGRVVVTVGFGQDDGEFAEGDDVRTEIVNGGAGDDDITGDGAGNELNGGGGSDVLDGGLGADTLNGDEGDDVLDGGAGTDADELNGGGGLSDEADYEFRTAALSLSPDGNANDGAAGETDDIGTDVENITGGSGADVLFGSNASNVITGNGGVDRVNLSARTDNLTITLDDVANDGAGAENDNIRSDVENIDSGSGDDTITGSPVRNVIASGAGDDTLDGGFGNDDLNGSTDTDTVTYASHTGVPVTVRFGGASGANDGGEGDALIAVENAIGGPADDHLVGTGGSQVLNGAGGNDTLEGLAGADTLQGGDGVDTADYSSCAANVVTVAIDGVAGDGCNGEDDTVAPDTEGVRGADGADQLTGSTEGNILDGAGGNDNLNGSAGDDRLIGGDGDDTLDGSTGSDTADYSTSASGVTVTLDNTANDGATGSAEADNAATEHVIGSAKGDVITGSAGPNTLTGGAGNDRINGAGGDDTIDGQAGDDTLNGDDGNDTITGGAGRDTLNGGAGGDTILARDGEVDALSCGDDADTVSVDEADSTAADCETVFFAPLPTPDSTPGGTTPAGTSPTGAPPLGTTGTPKATAARLLPRSISARAVPVRDRRAPYRFTITGTVNRPLGVNRATACKGGRVTAQVKVGSRTISTRRAAIDLNCRYRIRLSFADRKRLGRRGRLTVRIRFGGNDRLRARSGRTLTLRAG